jgi:hypothetical protein
MTEIHLKETQLHKNINFEKEQNFLILNYNVYIITPPFQSAKMCTKFSWSPRNICSYFILKINLCNEQVWKFVNC